MEQTQQFCRGSDAEVGQVGWDVGDGECQGWIKCGEFALCGSDKSKDGDDQEIRVWAVECV